MQFTYLLFVIKCILCIPASDENYASHCLSTEETCTSYFRYGVWETITWKQANVH